MEAVSEYLNSIQQQLKTSKATEHTYRSALETLFKSMGKRIVITNEPKRQACGAPDLIVTKGGTPLGYIETKDIGKSLGEIEADSQKKNPKTDNGRQLKRYREGLNNLIFTDYLEFRWYVGGTRRQTVVLATVDTKGKLHKRADGPEQLSELFGLFLREETPTIRSPKELAASMASLARVIRDSIERAFKGEDRGGSLHAQWEGFKTVLLHSLTHEQFADMYAQTICYGLFAAKCNKLNSKISRRDVAHDLPKTNPFLRKMFSHMAGPDLHTGVVWAVEDLINLLNHADFHAILSDFGKRTQRQDPIVHFYETFLAAYDPKLRETRGVYYTPEPVVSYIVRSIDYILKTDFGIKDGLADRTKIPVYKTVTDKNGKKKREKTGECHKVLILDPAVGTGSFLHGVIDHIHDHIVQKGQSAGWSSYVHEHLLPRLFGFELLMAPYAIAHLKLGLQLAETGYKPPKDKEEKRLGIYLTNSLEEAHSVQATLPFANFIAEEANAASDVKQEKPVMVILGNPPYSGHSENKGDWIRNLLRGQDSLNQQSTGNYFEVDGKPLGERNPKWLNDDYVKFIRFAQWRIEQTGYGVLGFITNHGYLDNPTFRGMRQSLMQTFDDIYVLDLHGNSKKKEVCPDGSKDENVFDIQQGVAIGIFVKHKRDSASSKAKTKPAKVHHADLWGLRKTRESGAGKQSKLIGGKYHWLSGNRAGSPKSRALTPKTPAYLFTQRNAGLLREYSLHQPLPDITLIGSVGVVTGQDRNTIGFAIDEARQLADKLGVSRDEVQAFLYRPLDPRFVTYSQSVVTRMRADVMCHMLAGENMGIVTTRQTRDKWDVLMSRHLIGHKALAAYDINYLFPLYLYPNGDLFDNGYTSEAPGGRRPNLNVKFIKEVAQKIKLKFVPDGVGDLKKTFGPEDIFHYMYAIFHSPTYRSRYAEFLKIDFPRLPLTTKRPLFRSLCQLGRELVGLHLMEQQGPPLARFEQEGDMLVEQVRFTDEIAASPAKKRTPRNDDPSSGKVWINVTQYFDGVPRKVWEFHIGGYQVCHKWLKDRKGRTLSIDDIEHYQTIVSALSETIRLMTDIDAVIDKQGGWPIE